jgi:outer membrane protein assembly factor BamB
MESAGGKNSWKMFRGDNSRTGASHSSSLSKRPHLLWVIELGPLIASPVVDNEVLYASTITGRVFAIQTNQRRIKWHSNIGSPIVSTPFIKDSVLVTATFDSWIRETKFLGKNLVLALNAKTGEQIWTFEIVGGAFSSPVIANDMIIIGTMNKRLHAIDMLGYSKWTFNTDGEVWSSPSFNGELIFLGSDDGYLYCLDSDGKLQWKTKLKGKIRSSSPCLSEDNPNMIFIGTQNGAMYCLNQLDGSIRWEKHITKPISSSPATSKNKVFFAASDRKVYCFDCNTGLKAWEFTTGDKIWSSPAISIKDETLFFGSLDSHIYGLDIKTGNKTWEFPTMDIIDSSPCIANNMLFMGGRDGLLYAFGEHNKSSRM